MLTDTQQKQHHNHKPELFERSNWDGDDALSTSMAKLLSFTHDPYPSASLPEALLIPPGVDQSEDDVLLP